MKPISFPDANRKLAYKPPKEAAQFFPEQFFTNGEESVYCYKPSWRERISVLFFGRVWLTMKLGKDIAPAMWIVGKKNVFDKIEKPAATPMVANRSCKRCHGTGRIGTARGKEILCNCLRPKADVMKEGHTVVPINSNPGGSNGK